MNAPAIAFHSATASRTWRGAVPTLPKGVFVGNDHALDALRQLDAASQHERWAGYFGYDLGRVFESLPAAAQDDLRLPTIAFATGAWQSIDPASIHNALPEPPERRAPIEFASTFTRRDYEAAVRKCLEYIAAGDVFQINLSQRFRVPTADAPWTIYQRLQRLFPAEFGAFLDFGDHQILSNSPECFLRVTRLPDGRRKIVNRPIKGTRPNAPGMADELRNSEKDRAELAMIVDLQRNDLGRICEIGSVIVTEPRTIETHPTVLHGVATVEGILRPDISLIDILRATFPCGSITGCPKIRAMQIIDELEPVRRGAYCGAIGWIENGEMEFSVAIRTITLKDGMAYVPVGGGIVADSTPADEYEETLVKARAMLSALGVARLGGASHEPALCKSEAPPRRAGHP
ncbi:MAG: anthranilate synthase component I family protein [Tepidisphaeraceae bacterium]